MRVHTFGNSPSPAVAMLGLKKTAQASGKDFGNRVTQFMSRNFYADGDLTSCTTKEEAINLIKDIQKALAMYGNLRLQKIALNSEELMKGFPANNLASNLKDLDLEANSKPLQGRLGLSWDVNTDKFLFQLSSKNKPITQRGILLTVNSIYDALRFLAPVIIYDKLLLRKLVPETVDWDQPLSEKTATEWISWKNTLETISKEFQVFSDASKKAIEAVAYLRTTSISGTPSLGFVLGRVKVAPTGGHTIPRLELCANVLAIEIAQSVKAQSLTSVDFYINAENFIIRSVQLEVYRVEIDCLQPNEPVPKCSQIANLTPFLDEQGILREGG
ncbi:uncharacterized protein [Palaemon carinicauda]|uniref:uncharacterized protein n=1 Tax=Palaemon carinicauda TaxID=392227 RepID=UPI0035B5D87D